MTEFHFLRPEWLWGFLVFLLLPFLAARSRSAGGLWRAACDRFLLDSQLVAGSARRGRGLPLFLACVSWGLAVLALAGPAWEKLPQPVLKEGTDTVFLWDISHFMNVSDLKPSRTDRARFKLYDFLKRADGGQYALILYDNEPFVAVPLTSDAKVIENVLPTVQAGMMGGRTPNLAAALNKAEELLKGAKAPDGNVVVLGAFVDDKNVAAAEKAAAKLKKEGYAVSVLGIGTERGAPIQMPDGTFLSDGSGKPFLSELSEKAFKSVAAAGGGLYRRAELGDADVLAVSSLRSDGRPDFSRLKEEMQKADAWKDAGVYLTLLILPFAALGFRRGWLGAAVLYFALAPSAQAFSWSDAFVRPDRREAQSIRAGNPARDPEVFGKDPAWRAAAQYKAGQYPNAAQTLLNAADAESLYNRGNALAHSGRFQEAIDSYRRALEADPKHEDAAFNKKYLEEELKKQQQQNQQQQNQQQEQNQAQQSGGGNSDRNEQGAEGQEDAGNEGREQNSSPNQGGGSENASAEQKNENGADSAENGKEASENRDAASEDASAAREAERRAAERAAAEEREERQERENQARGAAAADKDERGDKESDGRARAAGTDPDDEEKRRQTEWLSVIDDDPSGLLRERIRRRNARKMRMW